MGVFTVTGNLGSHDPVHYGHDVRAGDVISHRRQTPFYRVIHVDGDWAWVHELQRGEQAIVYHPHFQVEPRVEDLLAAAQALRASAPPPQVKLDAPQPARAA